MSELTSLELGVALWLVHLVVQVGAAQFALPLAWLLSSRDKPLPPKGLIYGRAERAMANYASNFVPFAALDLAFLVLHASAGVWPTVWILARALYIPLYLFNVVYVRSLVWGVSLAAIVMMLVRLTAAA